MLEMLKQLLSSKKFVVALVACVVWLAGRIGFHVDAETLAGAITPLLTFVLGQGIADHGKAAATINAATTAAVLAK